MKNNTKFEIRHLQDGDKKAWYSFDKHLPEREFDKKVRDGQGYVLTADGKVAGILRYNLFWDNTPFCTLLYIAENFRRKGYGKALIKFWESEMLTLGYDWILVSTQADENAQHFYRALGYADCGSLIAPNQPTELFLSKHVST